MNDSWPAGSATITFPIDCPLVHGKMSRIEFWTDGICKWDSIPCDCVRFCFDLLHDNTNSPLELHVIIIAHSRLVVYRTLIWIYLE